MTSRLKIFLPFAFALTACSSKDSTGPGTTTPETPVTRTATGVVYMRSDTIAYGTDATSSPLVSGAQLRFGDASGVSGNDGVVNVSTTYKPPSDYIPVTADAAGYQPTQTPYLLYNAAKPVQLALYPVTTVTTRPGFLKGFEFLDAGGGLAKFYADGRHAQVMDLVKTQNGATLVKTVEAFALKRFNIASNTVVMGGDPWGNYSREMYMNLINQAKARGLQFMMSFEITGWTNGPEPLSAADAAEFATRNQIPTTNTALWDAYFAAWSALLIDRVKIARDAGVEYIGLGQNLNYLTRLETSRWQKLISDIRATGYTGKIAYFGTVNSDVGYNEWTSMPAATRALFDIIGIRWGAVVMKATQSEVLAQDQTRGRMRADLTKMLSTMTSFGAPIIVLMTTPSVHGAPSKTEYIEPCLDANCVTVAPQRTLDFQQQADAYQAMAEAVNATPVGNGRVMGIITTQYWYFEDFTTGGKNAYDKCSSVRGKPAEMVLRWWFQRW